VLQLPAICFDGLSCEQDNNRTKLEKIIKKQGKKKNFVEVKF